MKKTAFRFVAFIMIFSVLFGWGTTSYAGTNDYTKNARFHKLTPEQMTEKFEAGDKFICFICDSNDGYSQKIGAEIVTSWMDDYGVDVYALMDYSEEELPDFVFEPFIVEIEGGYYAEINAPAVLFSEDCDYYDAYSSLDDDTMKNLENAFKGFYGITEKVLKSISIKNYPNKMLYVPGDTFSANGLALTLEYDDKSTATTYTGFTCSSPDMSTEGVKEVTVNYEGKSTSFEITVSNAQNYEFECSFHQEDARTMLSYINELRADAWYWNEDNKTKTSCKLKPVAYDYDLEKAAMQRAAELILYYSHTRTDGQKCFSVMPSNSYDVAAENIAYGYQSAYSVFYDGWEQSNKDYEGQGHRRNMLSPEVTAVGLACASYYDAESKQEIKFWVQMFRAPTGSTVQTQAAEGQYTVSVTLLNTNVLSSDIQSSVDFYNLTTGETQDLPNIAADTVVKNTKEFEYDLHYPLLPQCTWQSNDTNIVKVENGKVKGVLPGTTSVYTTVAGKTFAVPVTVTKGSASVMLKAEPASCTVNMGSSVPLPDLQAEITYHDSTKETISVNGVWEMKNTDVATLSEATVIPVEIGTTKLTATAYGMQLDVPVTVRSVSGENPPQTNPEYGVTYQWTAQDDKGNSLSLPASFVSVPIVTKTYCEGESFAGDMNTDFVNGSVQTTTEGETRYTWTFSGWTSVTNATTSAPVTDGKMPASAVTYHGVWVRTEDAKYGVTYQWTARDDKGNSVFLPANFVSVPTVTKTYYEGASFGGDKNTTFYNGFTQSSVEGNLNYTWTFGGWTSVTNDSTSAPVTDGKMPASSVTYHGVWVRTVKPGGVEGDDPPKEVRIAIRGYASTVKTDYKATVVFHTTVENMRTGAEIRWFVNGGDANKTGDSFKVEQVTGNTTVQAKVIAANGSVLAESGKAEIQPDTGFFAKFIAFFRGLFGSLPVIDKQ